MENENNRDEYLQKQGEIVMDLTIRLTSLERLLIKKNIVTDEELISSINEVQKELMELVSKTLEAQNEKST
jgi:hypothetical protein